MKNPDSGATGKRKNDEAWARFFADTGTLAAMADRCCCALRLLQQSGVAPEPIRSTPAQRAFTVRSWLGWLKNNAELI